MHGAGGRVLITVFPVCRVYGVEISNCGKAVKMKNMESDLGLRNLGSFIDLMMPSHAKPEQEKGTFYRDFVDKPLERTVMASLVASQCCMTITFIPT